MMDSTMLYETIFKRKSIRKYDMTPLEESELKEIVMQMSNLVPMDKNIKVEFNIVSSENVKNLLPVKAPHYIVISSETKEGYLTNVGFMFQQMDLFFSANGIGSCWLGMAKPTKEILKSSKLEFVIILAFGRSNETLHRKSVSEFKRKSLKEITNIEGDEILLEAARLAPSATNSQPWYFTGGRGTVHTFCVKLNPIKALIYEKMNKIDMGIAICHLWVAAKKMEQNIEFIYDPSEKDNAPSGYNYINTLRIKG